MDIYSVVESYSDERLSRSGVHIGSDVWSGREVHIKEGCTIGDGAVVGMRALVTRNLDPFSVNAGVPASRISYRFRRKQRKAIAQMRWWEWDQTQMNSQAALFANEFRAEKEID
jgi:virginiamycin A acetyltransferase